MDRACALILAAGDGKRMKSRCPKALCEVLFKPMLSWVTDSCRAAEIREICAVIAPDADAVAAVLPPGCETAIQEEKLGTGHAVMMAEGFLRRHRGDQRAGAVRPMRRLSTGIPSALPMRNTPARGTI